MTSFKKLVAILLVAAMLFTGQALSADSAFAGTNGQQVKFICSNTVEVWYFGQDPGGAGQTFHATFSPSVNQFTPAGYWWKGNLNINYKLSGSSTIFHKNFQVPTVHPWNTWDAYC